EDPYDPEDLRPSGGSHGDATAAWRLLCEWTATDFLSRFRGELPLCPHCYGGDMAEGFVILEDLGSGQRLRDLFLGNDPVPAEKALLGYATALGRMHGVSIGGEAEYDRFWDARGSRPLSMRAREAGLL